MARKKYEVRRSMLGDKPYERGDTRIMDENEARSFVENGQLKLLGDAPPEEAKSIEEMTRDELIAELIAGTHARIAQIDDDELRTHVLSFRIRSAPEADGADDVALGDLTIDQLKELAAKEDVDLAGKTLKADIVSAIDTKRKG